MNDVLFGQMVFATWFGLMLATGVVAAVIERWWKR